MEKTCYDKINRAPRQGRVGQPRGRSTEARGQGRGGAARFDEGEECNEEENYEEEVEEPRITKVYVVEAHFGDAKEERGTRE